MQDFFEHFGWAKDQSLRLIPSIPRSPVEGEKVESAELPVGGVPGIQFLKSQRVRSSYTELHSARAGEGILRQTQDKLCLYVGEAT